MKTKVLGLLALGLLAALAAPATTHAAQPTPPNVIVMIADDLGSGDVSCLFRDVVKTPNIDRLAAMGVKFTAGYVAAPLCGPSRAGFFTGLHPHRFGFVSNSDGIPIGLPLLPGVLHDAGYRTALIGKWHSAGPMPHERGCFDETLCSVKSSPFIDYHHPRLARNGKVETFNVYSTDLFASEAEGFIERNKSRPFNLTVTFNAPHILNVVEDHNVIRRKYDAAVAAGEVFDIRKTPTARPGEAEKYLAQFPGDKARADTVATIVALDQAVGRILDKLKAEGLDRKTVIFFFADNGGHPENRSENLPLRDYKWTVYEGGIHVPFIAAYPGVFPAGRTFENPVSSMDIFPTCTALAGIKPPANLDGVDLTPYLKGEKTGPPHDSLFFSQDGMEGVRQGQWKWVLPKNKKAQLFDLSKDIEEKHDLAAENPVKVKELAEKWQAWEAQMPPPQQHEKVRPTTRK
jgi:arylsulfatase A-like enzyme